MDILERLEHDQHVLSELRDLLQFASPGDLRKSLEQAIFHIFMEEEDPCLPNQRIMVSHFYYLINFLDIVDRSSRGERGEAGR